MRFSISIPILALSAALIAGCAPKPASDTSVADGGSSAPSQSTAGAPPAAAGAQPDAGMAAQPGGHDTTAGGSHAGHDHAAGGSHAGHDHAAGGAAGAHADASGVAGNPADVPRISIDMLQGLMKRGEAIVIDVRGKEAFNAGHIDGAIWMDDQALRNPGSKLPKDKKIVTYCA